MGVSTDQSADADLSAIYQGGENFLARMKAMTDQRSAIERMLAELNLGRDAKSAYDDARALQDNARKQLETSDQEAAERVRVAKETAGRILGEAQAAADALTQTANDNQRSSEEVKQSAAKLHAEAAEMHGAEDKKRAELESAIAAANSAKARAQSVVSIFKSAIDQASKL